MIQVRAGWLKLSRALPIGLLLAAMAGCKGDEGPEGPQGMTGIPGEQGEPGPAGPSDYTVFGSCTATDKVTGIDPTTGDVICAVDVDTDSFQTASGPGTPYEKDGNDGYNTCDDYCSNLGDDFGTDSGTCIAALLEINAIDSPIAYLDGKWVACNYLVGEYHPDWDGAVDVMKCYCLNFPPF